MGFYSAEGMIEDISCQKQSEGKKILRREFFVNSVGIEETAFRKLYKWAAAPESFPQIKELNNFLDNDTEIREWIKKQPAHERGAMPQKLFEWIKEYPARAAIFAGTIDSYTLNQLNALIEESDLYTSIKESASHRYPRLTIELYDPKNPLLTDIPFLMALPKNKNAGFQVASPFYGTLQEGNNHTIECPLQNLIQDCRVVSLDAEIALATAATTVYHTYFNPQSSLLEALSEKMQCDNKESCNNASLYYTLNEENKKNIAVGLHQGAVVSSCPELNSFNNATSAFYLREMPIFVDKNGLIDQEKTHTINLLYTTAFNVYKKEHLTRSPEVKAECQMLLNSSYEASLKRLALTGHPKIFLTLTEASAYSNPLEWIGTALQRKEIRDTIVKGALDVTLVYKKNKRAHNDSEKDADFLINMFTLAHSIKNSMPPCTPEIETAVILYTQALYTKQKEQASAYAQALMKWQKEGTYTAPIVNYKNPFLDASTHNKESTLPLLWTKEKMRSAQFNHQTTKIVTVPLWEKRAIVWDVETNEKLLTLEEDTGFIGYAAFSYAGDKIITTSTNHTAAIWNAQTGDKILTLKGHTYHITHAEFNHTGDKALTASYDGTALVWNTKTGEKIATLVHDAWVTHATFNQSSTSILTKTLAPHNTTLVWNAVDYTQIASLPDYHAAFSSTEDKILVTHFDKAQIVDLPTWTELQSLKRPTCWIYCATFNRCGDKILAGLTDSTAVIWDCKTGNKIHTLTGYRDTITCVAFNHTGDQVLTASCNPTAKIWDTNSGKLLAILQSPHRKYNTFTSAVFNKKGDRLLTHTNTGEVGLWDLSAIASNRQESDFDELDLELDPLTILKTVHEHKDTNSVNSIQSSNHTTATEDHTENEEITDYLDKDSDELGCSLQ